MTRAGTVSGRGGIRTSSSGRDRFAGLGLLRLRLRRPRPWQARSVSQPKQLSPPILQRKGEGAVDRQKLRDFAALDPKQNVL